MKVARSDVGRNAAGMHVLPGGGPIWLEGRRIITNYILTHSTYILLDILSFFPSIDTNPNPQRLTNMEGLKNAFAQCKKEGRVSLLRMQWQTTPPLHLLM
jgi:hypothetical protein